VLVDQLRQIVQREVTTALHSQQTTLTEHLEMALRSGAATPVPIASDPHQAQLQIGKLLHQGKINTAFQQVGAVYIVSEKYLIWLFFDELLATLKFHRYNISCDAFTY